MRVSDKIFSNNLLLNINKNKLAVDKSQIQLATGKKILSPSENPLEADAILRLNELVEKNKQYFLNIEGAESYMEATVGALDHSIDIFQDALDISTRVTSVTSPKDLITYADKFESLIQKFITVSNTSFRGKFLFGGSATLTPPYPEENIDSTSVNVIIGDRTFTRISEVLYAGDGTKIEIPVGDGVNVRMNMSGSEAFQLDVEDETTSAFQILIDFRTMVDDAVANGETIDKDTFIELTSKIRQMHDHIISKTQQHADTFESFEILKEQLDSDSLNIEELRASKEDTDIAKTVTDLQYKQIQLEAAYKVGANVLPKSLVDFL